MHRLFTKMPDPGTPVAPDSFSGPQGSCTVEPSASTRPRRGIGWPTLLVAAGIYGGFGLVTWFHAALPWWLLALLGGLLVAWHGSLQHEVVHGHPTRLAWFNRLLVLPSLWLWLPFERYRESHIRHHRDERLTDPLEDPESWYLTPERWAAAGRPLRLLLWVNNTLLGRLVLGPPLVVGRFLLGELRALAAGRLDLRAWAMNLLGGALVLGWVVGVCGLGLLEYLLLFVYPGIALTLLRSFAEHQARPAVGERTVVVEAGAPMALLYLNNNLHAAHHAFPNEPWFRLPAIWRAERARLLAGNGGYRFSGYAEIAARYLLWPKERVVHPGLFDLAPLERDRSGDGGRLAGELARPAEA